jgi:cell division protein ZapA
MGAVTVEVNGRAYPVGCEDGQERHVEQLARHFDSQVQEVAAQVGQVGELRLFLMAALLTADELMEARQRLARVEARLAQIERDGSSADGRAAEAIDHAAERIEALLAATG